MSEDTVRSLDDAQRWLREYIGLGRHPFVGFDDEAVSEANRVIDALTSTDPETWAATWGARSEAFADVARAASDRRVARRGWWHAYQFAFLGRYPSPLHPAKRRSYERAKDYFLRAVELDDPAGQRVEVPFMGRNGEGELVSFYVGRPTGVSRPPVIMTWGGIDMWKEESYARGAYLRRRGFATVHVDIPGVGESPILAGVDAERQWDPIFDWITGSDLDATRVVALGQSFGGYWAMKLGYTHRDRLRAVVNWGGGVHETFQPSWQERSRNASSYLMDLMATRASIFGGRTFEDYVQHAPVLSLLAQGLLDQPSAPMLLTNGKDDLQNSIGDLYLALEHGDPKSARVFPGGHMGVGPVMETVTDWIERMTR